jgi:dipeptidyl aminopeptidase/acylaminoacyl peptidase
MLTSVSFSQKKPFTIDDLYRLKGIGDLNLSPDGQQILFTVSETDLKAGKSGSDIYLLNLKGNQSQPKQMTFNDASDYHPFWSKDGQSIFFLSSRENGGQLWMMSASGGEASIISNFYTGVSSPVEVKNKDKKGFYFVSTVFPECMTDNACNEKYSNKLSEGAVQAHMADSLLFRHWTSYRDWSYSHLFFFDPVKDEVKAVTEGKMDYPCWNLGSGDGYDISPDGKTMVVVANHEKDLALSTNSDLFLVDLTAGTFTPRNITESNKAYDGSPVFSPDGKYIAFTRHNIPGYESDRKRLALYDVKSGEIKSLTESVDNWVNNFRWSSDSRFIYFTIDEKGYTPLLRVELKTGKIEEILGGFSLRDFLLTPDGKQLVFTCSKVGEPVELWRYKLNKAGKPVNKTIQRLTHFNKELEDSVDIRPAESQWIEGADGKQIQMFIVKPHNFDETKTYPVIVNIHGGPQMQWQDSFRGDWQVYPGSGYVVVFPNPHGSTGYGQAFTEAISKDWNGKVMEDIDKVAEFLKKQPYVDPERIGAMGWSWGGYAIMWLEGHNKHFKAMASMMGVYDLNSMFSSTEELWFPLWDLGGKPWDIPETYKEVSPSSYVKNFKTPCLIITGERDYRVPYHLSIQFFTDLQLMKVPSQLIIFKNDGHWPSHVRSMPVYYNAHLEWFHKYLKGGEAPYDTEKMIRNMAFDEENK